MRWFRMYASVIDSMKVGPLTDGGFRVYVELLCLACEKGAGGLTGVTAANINWRLRRDVTNFVTEVVTARLVGVTDEGEYRVFDWDEKQGDAKTGAERTREWRERKSLAVKDVTEKGDGVTSPVTNGDALEERRVEEKKNLSPGGECPAPPACPHQEIVDLYHQELPTHPRVLALNEHRRGLIRGRWRQVWEERGRRGHPRGTQDLLDRFRAYFAEDVAPSAFLTGKVPSRDGRPTFIADLEFLMGPKNFLKVLEGRYSGDRA